jgi:hypothetical protein
LDLVANRFGKWKENFGASASRTVLEEFEKVEEHSVAE